MDKKVLWIRHLKYVCLVFLRPKRSVHIMWWRGKLIIRNRAYQLSKGIYVLAQVSVLHLHKTLSMEKSLKVWEIRWIHCLSIVNMKTVHVTHKKCSTAPRVVYSNLAVRSISLTSKFHRRKHYRISPSFSFNGFQ